MGKSPVAIPEDKQLLKQVICVHRRFSNGISQAEKMMDVTDDKSWRVVSQ